MLSMIFTQECDVTIDAIKMFKLTWSWNNLAKDCYSASRKYVRTSSHEYHKQIKQMFSLNYRTGYQCLRYYLIDALEANVGRDKDM